MSTSMNKYSRSRLLDSQHLNFIHPSKKNNLYKLGRRHENKETDETVREIFKILKQLKHNKIKF